MARRRVKLINLDDAITDILAEYVGNVTEGTKKAVSVVAEEAKRELKASSPVHNRAYEGKRTPGRYAKGWAVKNQEERMRTQSIVHNRTDYQLAHLLEKGHALRQGGRSPAITHIKPVEDRAISNITKAVERIATQG